MVDISEHVLDILYEIVAEREGSILNNRGEYCDSNLTPICDYGVSDIIGLFTEEELERIVAEYDN